MMAQLHTGWHVNTKVLGVGLQGMGLHAWSISYCDHARSDGFIPLGAWPSLPGAGAAVKALLVAGLWERVDGGFQLHDYKKYNRLRAQIEAEQQASNDRQSRHRSRVTEPVTHTVTNGVSHTVPPHAGAPNPNPGVTLKRDTRNPFSLDDGDAQGASPHASPRELGTNARAMGTNPRALGTNPRATGTNPPADEPVEPLIIHASAGVCPLCRQPYLGSYIEHTAEAHKVRPKADDLGSGGMSRAVGSSIPDEVRERLAAAPIGESSA